MTELELFTVSRTRLKELGTPEAAAELERRHTAKAARDALRAARLEPDFQLEVDRTDWKQAVAAGDTELGLADWLERRDENDFIEHHYG